MIVNSLFLSAIGLGIAYNAAPGAVNTEALRRGLARGFRPALLVQLGALIGDTTWAALALTGTVFLVHNRSLRLFLGIAGACFLLRLAWNALQEAWSGGLPRAAAHRAATSRLAWSSRLLIHSRLPSGRGSARDSPRRTRRPHRWGDLPSCSAASCSARCSGASASPS